MYTCMCYAFRQVSYLSGCQRQQSPQATFKNVLQDISHLWMCRFDPESGHTANRGLGVARNLLEPIKMQYPWITYADLYTLAGAVAIEEMGGRFFLLPFISWWLFRQCSAHIQTAEVKRQAAVIETCLELSCWRNLQQAVGRLKPSAY